MTRPAPASPLPGQAGQILLQIRDLQVFYGNSQALHGVSLDVPAGSIVALLGANGAGKTTTLRAISGVTRAAAGTISFAGQAIQGLPPDAIVAQGIIHVPEGRKIFPELTVRENLLVGAYARRDRASLRRDLAAVFARFPRLAERQHQPGGTLSGGEQQMLAIGRALMARPRLLLLDEPSMGLAPKLVQGIFRTIAELNAEGTTILLVEQNSNLALQISHYGYVLENGRIALHDTAVNLRNNDQVRRSYLGG